MTRGNVPELKQDENSVHRVVARTRGVKTQLSRWGVPVEEQSGMRSQGTKKERAACPRMAEAKQCKEEIHRGELTWCGELQIKQGKESIL